MNKNDRMGKECRNWNSDRMNNMYRIGKRLRGSLVLSRSVIHPVHLVNPVQAVFVRALSYRLGLGADVYPALALEIQSIPAEIQKEAHVHPGCGEIINELHLICRRDHVVRFEFDKNHTVDKQVYRKITNGYAVIVNRYGFLTFHLQACLVELMRKRSLVDGFEKPRAQSGVNLHGTANDHLC
jgi:hypothetical protein